MKQCLKLLVKKMHGFGKIYLSHFKPCQSINCLYQQRGKDTFTPIFHNISMLGKYSIKLSASL